MENIINEINYGTHQFVNVFFNSFKSLTLFIILFIISIFISKKTNKKTFCFNNIFYLILFIFYLIISIIKAYNISNLPPHDLLKDFCSLKFDIIQLIISFYIPIIYTILLFANLLDNKRKRR